MFPANDNYIGSAVLRSKILINVAERQVMGKAVGYIQKAAGFGRKAAVYKKKASGFLRFFRCFFLHRIYFSVWTGADK